MLIRFVVKNLFSFNDATEFNMLPSKATRLKHHKYKLNDEIEVLKLAAIYGANASGKSNLVNALKTFKFIVIEDEIIENLDFVKYKLSNSNSNLPIEFSIEFSIFNKIYYYSLSTNNSIILEEYLSEVLVNTKEDRLVFHRIYSSLDDKTKIKFDQQFEYDEKNKILIELIENNLLKKHQSLINLISGLNFNKDQFGSPLIFTDIYFVHFWFSDVLAIIHPHTYNSDLPMSLEASNEFKKFAIDLLRSTNTGIVNLKIETISIEEFYGKDNSNEIEEMKKELLNSELKFLHRKIRNEIFNFSIENNKVVVKKIFYCVLDDSLKEVEFEYAELSDGTKRIIDFISLLSNLIKVEKVFIIDEIERSIHPILIKELITKFSKEQNTKGQLIFTSHESNLLDQDILRTDEIWFAEKNKNGETKLYSLSDFKEHSTIDIRKGYLQGRYGGIPFMSNLQDLNWHKEDVIEK